MCVCVCVFVYVVWCADLLVCMCVCVDEIWCASHQGMAATTAACDGVVAVVLFCLFDPT